jgi:hypothetical protein
MSNKARRPKKKTEKREDSVVSSGVAAEGAVPRVLWWLAKMLGKILAVGIGYGLALWLYWRPNVLLQRPLQAVDPLDPYAASFSIENAGNLSIYEVRVTCLAHAFQLKALNSKQSKANAKNVLFVVDRLKSGERREFSCDVFKFIENPMEVQYAELAILLSYRAAFDPFRSEQSQVYVAQADAQKILRWAEWNPPLQERPGEYPPKP